MNFQRVFQLVVISSLLVPTSFSSEAGLLDSYVQKKTFPECHDAKVLQTIVKRFNWAEDRTWKRGFHLDDVELARERMVQKSTVSSIARRYCRGHARLTNGKHPTLYYLIEEGQGFAGNHFNVEFCLGGYDRWNEYDGSCRVLRY